MDGVLNVFRVATIKKQGQAMKVLVACECSGAVRDNLIKLGHDAISCDIQPTDEPGPHYEGDVLDIINDGWDMMIAFPPCTHLAASGAAWFKEKREDGRQQEGIDFFMAMVNAPIKKIAIENPIGIMSMKYRKPDQIIHPYYFGDPEPKSTCLWLKNLLQLKHFPQDDMFNKKTWVEPEYIIAKNGNKYSHIHYMGGGKSKERSITYPGIAKAMAEQWV